MIGMRNPHLIRKGNVVPIIHVERVRSVVSEQSRTHWADEKDKAPVIDVMKAGHMKVIGKGKFPEHQGIVSLHVGRWRQVGLAITLKHKVSDRVKPI